MDREGKNQKLAEFCELTDFKWTAPCEYHIRGQMYFKDKNGNEVYSEPFTHSLDACFKWLVPRFTEVTHWLATLSLLRDWVEEITVLWPEHEGPAVVLCKRIGRNRGLWGNELRLSDGENFAVRERLHELLRTKRVGLTVDPHWRDILVTDIVEAFEKGVRQGNAPI